MCPFRRRVSSHQFHPVGTQWGDLMSVWVFYDKNVTVLVAAILVPVLISH